MEKTYQRVNNLYKDGVVAEQKRDEAKTQWQAAKYTESAALQMYKLAQEGARDETKVAAAQRALMAAGAVAEVEAYAKDTQIHSWFNGEVAQVLLSSGELAPQGFPVVTVIDTQGRLGCAQCSRRPTSSTSKKDPSSMLIFQHLIKT